MRTFAAVAAVVVLTVACGAPYAANDPDSIGSRAEEDVPAGSTRPDGGSPSPTPQRDAEATDDPSPPLYVLRLTDQDGRHPSGIRVLVTGETDRTAVTDDRGEVRLSRPGSYELSVDTGCYDGRQVSGGGSASVELVPGFAKTGSLDVRWRHRYAPGPPARAGTGGHWIPGQLVELTFSVVDHCAGGRIAPNAGFPAFRYERSPTVEVVGERPLVSDSEGRVELTIRCHAEGDATLILRDRDVPSEWFDPIEAATDVFGPHRCRRSPGTLR